MSSSTSSFRQEAKVLAIVAAVLLAGEFAVRGLETRLSRDMLHIRSLPDVATRVAGCRDLRVLFVSSSKVRTDIAPAVVKDVMTDLGAKPLEIERVFPDDTSVIEWYYYLKHYFVDAHCEPDILIVCFADTALQDDRAVHPERLGAYGTGADDIPEVFRDDIGDFGQRTEFLLSKVSCAFANRRRIRSRLLDSLIPGYRGGADRLNAAIRSTGAVAADQQYRVMTKLIDLTRKEDMATLLVAMPTQHGYAIDGRLLSALRSRGVPFLDLRQVDGIGDGQFRDSLHLTEEGATVFSKKLATELMSNYPAIFKKTSPRGSHL